MEKARKAHLKRKAVLENAYTGGWITWGTDYVTLRYLDNGDIISKFQPEIRVAIKEDIDTNTKLVIKLDQWGGEEGKPYKLYLPEFGVDPYSDIYTQKGTSNDGRRSFWYEPHPKKCRLEFDKDYRGVVTLIDVETGETSSWCSNCEYGWDFTIVEFKNNESRKHCEKYKIELDPYIDELVDRHRDYKRTPPTPRRRESAAERARQEQQWQWTQDRLDREAYDRESERQSEAWK